MVRDAFVIVAPLQLGPGVLVRIIAAGAPQSGADHHFAGGASAGVGAGPSQGIEGERGPCLGRGTISHLAHSPGLAAAPGQLIGSE